MAGLADAPSIVGLPQNLRFPDPNEAPNKPGGRAPSIYGDAGVRPSKKNKVLSVELPDGSVNVYIGGPQEPDGKPSKHDDNLVDQIGDDALAAIADDLLRAIEEDEQARDERLEINADGLRMLGLMLKKSTMLAGVPVEGMSTVVHPLLLEAVLRFQANARSELLPTDGPVKIRDDDVTPQQQTNDIADALEIDFNHYLTVTAKEYYTDTDKMLFWVGFIGTGFKKLYHCPLRRRPVSESIDASDISMSNDAVDINNASRVTHSITMRQSVMKRMQLVGAYVDIPLGQPLPQDVDSVKETIDEIQGIEPSTMRPEDEEYTIKECRCELDLPGFEHKEKGEVTGLPLPYIVSIDKDSRQVLAIKRNWKEGDERCLAKQRIVQYSYINGLGPYGIGLLHILGNTTNALTAAERELLDAGMFSNFPGFLYSKGLGRQNTLDMRVGPGQGRAVDTNSGPLKDNIMPLPYKPPDATTLQLLQALEATGQRLGGTAEIQVGEGRQDAPVGTTIALIEQATQVQNAVHKRLFEAQSRELQIFIELFREDPEAFWRDNPKPAKAWDVATFMQALEDADLVPVADPNTSSHMQRLMIAQAIKQMQMANPQLYDGRAVDLRIYKMIRVPNPQELFAPPQPGGTPPADPRMAMAQAKMMDAQTKQASLGLDAQSDKQQSDAKLAIEQMKMQDNQASLADQAADRESKERLAQMSLQKEMVIHRETQQAEMQRHVNTMQSEGQRAELDNAHEHQQNIMGHAVDLHVAETAADAAKEAAKTAAKAAKQKAKPAK